MYVQADAVARVERVGDKHGSLQFVHNDIREELVVATVGSELSDPNQNEIYTYLTNI